MLPTSSDSNTLASLRATAIALWGVGGIALLLVQALIRLTPLAAEPLLDGSLTGFQMALYAGCVVAMAYAEGYRGFQLKFVPRVVSRAFHLGTQPGSLLRVLLAPAFSMSLFHAKRRTFITSWVLLVLMTVLVVTVKAMPQPWRGIIDGGVVVGLTWGLVALLAETWRSIVAGPRPPTDLPAGEAAG